MTRQMMELLSDSGCIEIWFGAESWSQKILDNVNKRNKIEQNYEFVRLCNEFWIKVKAFLMMGLPGEDHDTIKETESFLSFLVSNTFENKFWKTITNDFDITVYFPYKGTKIRDSIDNHEWIYDISIDSDTIGQSDWYYKWKGGSWEIAVSTKVLSKEEIHTYKDEMYAKYKEKVVF
jgi:radical SAM superfamily enzyme YgiQ (UPF0313 family)